MVGFPLGTRLTLLVLELLQPAEVAGQQYLQVCVGSRRSISRRIRGEQEMRSLHAPDCLSLLRTHLGKLRLLNLCDLLPGRKGLRKRPIVENDCFVRFYSRETSVMCSEVMCTLSPRARTASVVHNMAITAPYCQRNRIATNKRKHL